ncbi:flippase [Archaeoglobus sulfaticallidus]|uniref:flippase n=1 Tax=Archaeoglobus sulfaticallidus TaxID=1316941 RepID=UPI00064E63E5|nr:flippase [Archaeoglobus sulfaticallidus]
MEFARRVARNALFNLLSLIVGSLSGLLLSITLARILGAEQFGVYSLAIAVGSMAISFATLGIDNAVMRYIAFSHGRKDLEGIRAHFYYFAKVKAVITLIVSTILITLSPKLAEIFNDERLSIPFALAGLIVLVASFSNFLNSFFRGLQKFDYSFFRQIVYETSRWVFVIPLALFFLASGAVLGSVLAYTTSLIFLFVLAIKHRELIFGNKTHISPKVNNYMGFMTIASISGIVYAYVDSIMIGYLMDTTYVGYYRAAYTIVFAIIGFASSLATVLLPTFTQISLRDIENALERLNRYSAILAFPSVVLLSHFSKELISTLYGRDFLPSASVMFYLSFALIPGTFSYLITIFNAKERADIRAYIVITSMVLNVALNYALIIKMGITGAAIATVISRFFVISATIVLLNRVLGLQPKIGSCLRPLVATVIMFIVLLVLPKPESIYTGILEILLTLMIYFLLLVGLKALTKKDLRYIKSVIG